MSANWVIVSQRLVPPKPLLRYRAGQWWCTGYRCGGIGSTLDLAYARWAKHLPDLMQRYLRVTQ